MIVLASASPRRRELLGTLGLDFKIEPAVGEEHTPEHGDAAETVTALARAKAAEVAAKHPQDIVIGADTVVVADGRILGKPRDAADAAEMLRLLSGRSHTVCTGLCLMRGDTVLTHAEETAVHFRALTDAEIAAYVETGEPMDKAGAYAIQGLASLFITGIEGDYFNVVGLPLCALGTMLQQMGVSLL